MKFKYTVNLKIGYYNREFVFDSIDEATVFAKTALVHQRPEEDCYDKDYLIYIELTMEENKADGENNDN